MVNGVEGTVIWPVVLIIIAVLWGALRIVFLRTAGVRVLSFLSRQRTPAEKGLAAVGLILDAYLLVRAFHPPLDPMVRMLLLPFGVTVFGLLIMTAGIALVIAAQAQMGQAWRIGVPTQRETGQRVVTNGVFRLSRNPIYLGIMMFLLGACFAVPGPLTWLCFISSAVLMRPLIAREEAFMRDAFGADYTAYCRQVRRWL